jgi:hypothetical protein
VGTAEPAIDEPAADEPADVDPAGEDGAGAACDDPVADAEEAADDPLAVLDDEQAASEPTTAQTMNAVSAVRRAVEERVTLILPWMQFVCAAISRQRAEANRAVRCSLSNRFD